MTNHDPLIGKTLRGEYVIEAILGEGGMGAVYRARQKSLDRIVAVKIMHPQIAKEKGFIDRFNREAQTSARLEHPNIVPIYDYGQEDGYVYLVMRLLTGGTLSERLSADKRLPSLAEVARIVRQIAGALDYAHHKGVIHRDMKPSNIMFDENGTPYLVDFGIAKLVSSNSGLTGTGMAIGTPNFMPPEQWRGDTITASADQYALGVIVYNTLTGKLPFEGDTPFVLMHKHLNEYPTPLTQYRADLPPSVMNILLQALAKDAHARFNSCSQFANALESVAQGGEYGAQTNAFLSSTPPQRGRTPTPSKTPYSTPPQNRRGMVIGAVGIVALLLIGGLLALLSGGGDDTAKQSATSTVGSVVILITDTPPPTTELSPTDTLSPTPSPTSTETPTPDILTAIAYIDETNTAQAPLNLTATAQAQQVTPTTDFTATIDAIMANRTATQQIAESIATNLAQKATDQAITDLTATQNAVSNIAQQSNADQLATQAALDRIATEIALDQTATATLWTLTPSITPTATLTYTPTYTPSPTATATFTPTAIPPDAILGRVNVRGGLNLRRDPDSTAEILFLIPENTVLIITARNSNSEWVYGSLPTEVGLIYGWVFAQYVTITDAVGNPVNLSDVGDMAVLEPVSMLDEVMFSSLLATVEGGTFNMGTTAREVSSAVEECITRDSAQCTIQMGEDAVPVHTVTLDTFLIEATEVTNAQYIAFLNWMGANSHTDGCLGQRCITIIAEDDASYIAFDGQTYSVVNALFDDFPMVNVTWYGAQAYCQTIGRRLPTEAEWERAARGTQDFIYPWGNIWDDSLANTRNSGLEGLMFVRNFIAGQSPFGVFDMAGNAAEWVNDWYSEAYYRSPEASQVNPQGPATGTERIVRGGSWDAVPFFARTVHRQSLSPDTASPSVGFRCASDYVETSSAIAPTPVVGQLVLVQQDFEKGKMFWFEATNEIWVILNDESREWQKHQSAWNVTMPMSDETIVPPNGLYQPVRGFGLLWRTDTDLRDRLGWATAQEFGYVADYLYFIENTQVYHVIVGLDDISYIFDENNQTWLEFENSPQ